MEKRQEDNKLITPSYKDNHYCYSVILMCYVNMYACVCNCGLYFFAKIKYLPVAGTILNILHVLYHFILKIVPSNSQLFIVIHFKEDKVRGRVSNTT